MGHSSLHYDAAVTCGGCASSFRADINFICKDDCNGGSNIELSGCGDTTTATGLEDGSSRSESLPLHHRNSFDLLSVGD